MIPHIIHTQTRPERLKKLMEELREQGIYTQRVWLGEIHHPTPRQNISQSHKNIIAHAKKMNFPAMLIMENDCTFTDKNSIRYFEENIPNDYDIYLGGIYTNAKRVSKENNKITYPFSGLHCYIVHSKFYDTFLNLNTEKQDIDNAIGLLARQGKADVYCCYPMIAIQQESISDNTQCLFRHENYFQKEMLYEWEK